MDIYKITQKEPFEFESLLENQLFCRYLVEDNEERKGDFGFETSNSMHYVRSVLRTLLGDYKVLQESQERELKLQLEDIIGKRLKKIIVYLPDKDSSLSLQGLRELFNNADAELNKDQLHYVALRLFRETGEYH